MPWNSLIDDICESLNASEVPPGIENEAQFEVRFVEPIVRRCITSDTLQIYAHPWIKPDTPKPLSPELAQRQISWKACKEWANVTAWGMKHTLDMFIQDSDTLESIAIEVKLSRIRSGKMPTGDFQRMIGQSLLFLGQPNHKAVIAVFGLKGGASGHLDDNGMGEHLRQVGVWPVILRVP